MSEAEAECSSDEIQKHAEMLIEMFVIFCLQRFRKHIFVVNMSDPPRLTRISALYFLELEKYHLTIPFT